jgi:hypothetical protein
LGIFLAKNIHPNWSNPWAFGPPKGMKNALCPATALPFVIPSEAERICSSADLLGNVFRQSVAKWRDLLFSLPVFTHHL